MPSNTRFSPTVIRQFYTSPNWIEADSKARPLEFILHWNFRVRFTPLLQHDWLITYWEPYVGVITEPACLERIQLSTTGLITGYHWRKAPSINQLILLNFLWNKLFSDILRYTLPLFLTFTTTVIHNHINMLIHLYPKRDHYVLIGSIGVPCNH